MWLAGYFQRFRFDKDIRLLWTAQYAFRIDKLYNLPFFAFKPNEFHVYNRELLTDDFLPLHNIHK